MTAPFPRVSEAVDRLYLERMARLVLDRLVDSGELRSVASQRALAFRMHYLPQHIRLEVPASDDFLPLLDPNRKERATTGLREAVLRVVTHEESDHWVVADPNLHFDVRLREKARTARVRPIYEPDLDQPSDGSVRLGEPRLRLSWEHKGRDDQQVIFREREGLAKVDLGRWRPELVILEARAGDDAVAYLYSAAVIRVLERDRWRRVRPRRRVPVSRDLTFVIRSPWWRFWQRRVRVQLEVLGLLRLSRPKVTFTSSAGQEVGWDRNLDAETTVGPEFVLRAGEHDVVSVGNTGDAAATIKWFDGGDLTVPAGGRVDVQGTHLQALETPGGGLWVVSFPTEVRTPRPRQIKLSAAAFAPRRLGADITDPGDGPALFGFEAPAAEIVQDALLLDGVAAEEAVVAVKSSRSSGPLAVVALDDCPGVKVKLLRTDAGDPIAQHRWRHVTDVLPLPGTSARLEAVGAPVVTFELPRPIGELTTDPDDSFAVSGWRFSISADGLQLAGTGKVSLDIDGTRMGGPTRLPYQDMYRLRVGGGIYRILRGEHAPVGSTGR